MLKGQDVVILLKLVAYPQKPWNRLRLSQSLEMNYSTLHGAVERLVQVKLIGSTEQDECLRANTVNVKELLFHSLRFFFPPESGGLIRGVPTGYAAPVFEGLFAIGSEPPPVWASALGTVQGFSLTPLVKNAAKLAQNDARLYEFLAMADVLRGGRAREVEQAKAMLENRMAGLA